MPKAVNGIVAAGRPVQGLYAHLRCIPISDTVMCRRYRDIPGAGVFLRCGPKAGGRVAVMHINLVY